MRSRTSRSLVRRVIAIFAAFAVLAMGVPAATAAQPEQSSGDVAAKRAIALSKRAVPVDDGWKKLVIAPGRFAYPKVVTVQGDAAGVRSPDGLKDKGGAATTISSSSTKLLLDLGLNTGGFVEVAFTEGSGLVRLAYAEDADYMTPLGDTIEGSLGSNDGPPTPNRYDVFTASPGAVTRSANVRGGQRFIELSLDTPGPVTIDYVRVKVTHLRTPVEEHTGHFLSNDPVLNAAWYGSAYTFDVSTEKESGILMDGAKRDRMAFIGDLTVGAITGVLSSGRGAAVAKNTIRVFSCQQASSGYIPGNSQTNVDCPEDPPEAAKDDTGAVRSSEYVAWYIVAARLYLDHTGDAAYIKKLLPVLRRAADYLRRNSTDGWLTPSRPVEYGWKGTGSVATANQTYTQMVVYRAYRTLASLEHHYGKGENAAKPWYAAANATREQIMSTWDAKVGAFHDSRDATSGFSQDANVMAVLAGVVKGAAARRALDYVRKHLWTPLGTRYADVSDAFISPYIGSYELEARMRAGETEHALKLLRATWGHMSTRVPGTMWEKMALDGRPQANTAPGLGLPTSRPEGEGFSSLAHAWSTGPVQALSEYVLGLRPRTPGYDRWLVAPQLGGLRWAQGQLGTPHGPLVSRWQRGSRSFRLTVEGPAGTRGDVVVPLLSKARVIAMDGRVVWPSVKTPGGMTAVRRGDGVRFTNVTGRHTFAWHG